MATKTTGTHPPSLLPYDASAFHTPTPEELTLNQPYWQGYSTGQSVCTGIPGPAGSGSYDNALIDWSNYLWTHDPESPHKKPPPA